MGGGFLICRVCRGFVCALRAHLGRITGAITTVLRLIIDASLTILPLSTDQLPRVKNEIVSRPVSRRPDPPFPGRAAHKLRPGHGFSLDRQRQDSRLAKGPDVAGVAGGSVGRLVSWKAGEAASAGPEKAPSRGDADDLKLLPAFRYCRFFLPAPRMDARLFSWKAWARCPRGVGHASSKA